MVICVEASTIHTAMDEREAKAVPSTMVMTKKTSLESAEESELRWGFRVGLQNGNDGHHVTAKEEEATMKFGVKTF